MDTAHSVRPPAGRDDARHVQIERLRAEQRSGAGVVVVLDQLDYLDSAGIGELVESCDRARADGRRFAVTPGSGNVRRVLWISGVLSRLCDAGTDPSARHHP